MKSTGALPWIPVFLSSLCYAADAKISFTTNTPTQCDDFKVDWTGGTPPYNLLLSPLYGRPKNMTIPDSAFSNGRGSWSFQLALDGSQPNPKRFLVTLSDSTGFQNGITSEIKTVGASLGGNCNPKDLVVDFFFETPSSLQQCRAYSFNNFSDAVLPVTIYGLIPLGDMFIINPPSGRTSFDWTADVAASNSVIFVMVDSKGRMGGSTDLNIVQSSDDSTCLDKTSPSSTASAPPTSTSSSSDSSPSSTPGSKTSMAAIAGTVIGSLLFLAMTITLGLFLLKRMKDKKDANTNQPRVSRRYSSNRVDLNRDGQNPFSGNPALGLFPNNSYVQQTPGDYSLPPGHEPSPYTLTPGPFSSHYEPSLASSSHLQSAYTDAEYNPFSDQRGAPNTVDGTSSRHRSKRSIASTNTGYQSSRFILHTDMDELQPNEEGVIELPPQYTERRGPMSTISEHSQSTNPKAASYQSHGPS